MSLSTYLNKKVCIITTDGRTLVGDLTAFDNNTNLVLSHTIERVIRPVEDPEPSSQVEHGLYLIRGDNVVIIGQVDEELDQSINWTKVRGEVIGGTKHGDKVIKSTSAVEDSYNEVQRTALQQLQDLEDWNIRQMLCAFSSMFYVRKLEHVVGG